jgi:hypothetical protein
MHACFAYPLTLVVWSWSLLSVLPGPVLSPWFSFLSSLPLPLLSFPCCLMSFLHPCLVLILIIPVLAFLPCPLVPLVLAVVAVVLVGIFPVAIVIIATLLSGLPPAFVVWCCCHPLPHGCCYPYFCCPSLVSVALSCHPHPHGYMHGSCQHHPWSLPFPMVLWLLLSLPSSRSSWSWSPWFWWSPGHHCSWCLCLHCSWPHHWCWHPSPPPAPAPVCSLLVVGHWLLVVPMVVVGVVVMLVCPRRAALLGVGCVMPSHHCDGNISCFEKWGVVSG